MIIAVDLDGMLVSFPQFFQEFFAAMQKSGSKVGILSARPDSEKKELLEGLKKANIVPNFIVLKPDDFEASHGTFKALVCNELDVDLLFDDFQTNDPQMLADFFATNTKTVPFTSWAYDPDPDAKVNNPKVQDEG